MRAHRGPILCAALLCGCSPEAKHPASSPTAASRPVSPSLSLISSAYAAPPAAAAATPALDPARGQEVGMTFEAYLSPHQEPDEEENTPSTTPAQFKSTTPSQSRAAREAAGHRGHGKIRFSKDLSRAFIDVRVDGVKPATINMFHIHCGKPGILGPILLDFAQVTDLQKELADGVLTVEVRNEHLVKTSQHAHGVVGAFTAGCVINSPSLGSAKPSKVSTVAGMAQIALEGELYFNLHTTGQTYFGDMRGQIHPAEK